MTFDISNRSFFVSLDEIGSPRAIVSKYSGHFQPAFEGGDEVQDGH